MSATSASRLAASSMVLEPAQEGRQLPEVQELQVLSCLLSLPNANTGHDVISPWCTQQQAQLQQQTWRLHQARHLPSSYAPGKGVRGHIPCLAQPSAHATQPQGDEVQATDDADVRSCMCVDIAACMQSRQCSKRRAEQSSQSSSAADKNQEQPALVQDELHSQEGGFTDSHTDDMDAVASEQQGDTAEDEDESADVELPAEVLQQLLHAVLRLLHSAQQQLQQTQQQQASTQHSLPSSNWAATVRLVGQLQQHCSWLLGLPRLPVTNVSLPFENSQQCQQEYAHGHSVARQALHHDDEATLSSRRASAMQCVVDSWQRVIAAGHGIERQEGRAGALASAQQQQEEQGFVQQVEQQGLAGLAHVMQVDTQQAAQQHTKQQHVEQDAAEAQDSKQLLEHCRVQSPLVEQQQLLQMQEHQVNITQDHREGTQQVVFRTVCLLFPPGVQPTVRSGSGAWVARRSVNSPLTGSAGAAAASSSTAAHIDKGSGRPAGAPQASQTIYNSLLAVHQQLVQADEQQMHADKAQHQAQAQQTACAVVHEDACQVHSCEVLLQLRVVQRDEVARLVTEQTQLQALLQLPRPPSLLTWLPDLLELADSLDTLMMCVRARILPLIAQTLASKHALDSTGAAQQCMVNATERQGQQVCAAGDGVGSDSSGQQCALQVPSLTVGPPAGASQAPPTAAVAAAGYRGHAMNPMNADGTARPCTRRRLLQSPEQP